MRIFKHTVCILCAACALVPAFIEPETAIIHQYEDTFQDSEFSYLGRYFWENGCGPSSVANAFISGLEVTDEQMAAAILYDVMHIMSLDPDRYAIDVKRFPLLATEDSAILQICNENGWGIVAIDKQLTHQDLSDHLSEIPVVILSKQVGTDYWQAAVDYAQYLYDQGCHDATIYLVRASTGTSSVSGPLAFGSAGHYVTFYMPVGEFIKQGDIYLLDSAASALQDEPFGKSEFYKQQYPFVAQPYAHKVFLQTFGVERIHPNIVRFYLLNPETDRLTAARLFELYGTTFWVIFIK